MHTVGGSVPGPGPLCFGTWGQHRPCWTEKGVGGAGIGGLTPGLPKARKLVVDELLPEPQTIMFNEYVSVCLGFECPWTLYSPLLEMGGPPSTVHGAGARSQQYSVI